MEEDTTKKARDLLDEVRTDSYSKDILDQVGKKLNDVKPSTIALAGIIEEMTLMLALTASDPEKVAENYHCVTVQWTGAILAELPFDRMNLAFIRPGAKDLATLNFDLKREIKEVHRLNDLLNEELNETLGDLLRGKDAVRLNRELRTVIELLKSGDMTIAEIDPEILKEPTDGKIEEKKS